MTFTRCAPLACRFEAGKWWETDTTLRALESLSRHLISQVNLLRLAWLSPLVFRSPLPHLNFDSLSTLPIARVGRRWCTRCSRCSSAKSACRRSGCVSLVSRFGCSCWHERLTAFGFHVQHQQMKNDQLSRDLSVVKIFNDVSVSRRSGCHS